MTKKTIHHIALTHMSPNITGGEVIFLGIVRYLARFSDFEQIIYTSESGRDLYSKKLGEDGKKIDYVVIGEKKFEQIHEYVAYYLRIFQSLFKLKKFSNENENIILSHEEFLPTSIYSLILKKLNKKARWFAFIHMLSPSICKGFEGEYTNRYKVPSLRIIRYKFEQWLFFRIVKNNTEKVITVNPCYGEVIKKLVPNPYVLKVYSGEEVELDKGVYEKEFDICFMGRFHEQKGLFELVDILKRLKEKKFNIKLVLLGGGVKRVEKRFFDLIKQYDLENNTKFFGYVTGEEKFEILKKSKVFVFPSYYESFGQVALEALRCGLPVVAYDLPPFVVFTGGVVKVPALDNKKMADEILKILDDKTYYEKLRKEGFEFCTEYTWDKTADEVYKLLS